MIKLFGILAVILWLALGVLPQKLTIAEDSNPPASSYPPPPDIFYPPAPAERISLDLKGIDIVELFRILSMKSGLTIITTPGVSGTISVFLNNLTFEDALDVVVTMQNLAYERRDNLIKVMTGSEYEALFGKKFSAKQKIETIKLAYAKPTNVVNVISSLKSEVGKIIVDEGTGTILLVDTDEAIALMKETIKELDQPLGTAVFDINYAKAADIKTYLNELITAGVGQVIIDERSSKAIVSDLPQRLVRIKNLMSELDEASRQVLITGEIVQVTLSDKFEQGIDWEKLFGAGVDSLDLKGYFPFSSSSSYYQKVTIGTLATDYYNTLFKFLQTYGDTKVLSRPQIVAVNKEEAKVLVGSREAYITSTQSQGESTTVTSESVEFIDVGVKLKVTPTIGKDGFITMKIKPEISSVRETLTTSQNSIIPIVQTSEVETVVKVKDGTMIMIGGLMKEEKKNPISGWPGISKVPFLGALVSRRAKENNRTELIVFLTPHIITGDTPFTLEGKKIERKPEK